MKKFFTHLLLLPFLCFAFSAFAQADVTVTSSAVAASSLTQGSSNNIVYVAKMDVATQGVNVTSAQITLGGSHDADDFTAFLVYFNPTAPTFSGATFLNSVTPSFAGPHTYSITGFNRAIAAGSSGYFIFLVNVSATGTTGNTVKVNGATNPVVFGFSTGPNITNMQTDVAGTQTIQAADVTVTSSAVAASSLTQGSSNNIVYVAKMDVATQGVNVTSAQITLGGSHDADDFTAFLVYFNPTAPTFSGATFLNSVTPSFAGPHTYSITGFNRAIAAGSSGYFIFLVNVSATGTTGNTVKVNGATNPVVFGFSTGPNITNMQTDVAGTQTIQAADVTVTSSAVAASSLTQGSSNNIVYVAKMDVATQGVNVTSAQITLGGSHDADDFTAFLVYFNPTAPTFSGATFLNSVTPSFAGPHTYSITGFNRAIAAGSSGYFIFLVNVSATGTTGNTVKVNGATNPVVFGFSTGPNITNMQTDVAGTQTIQAADVTVTSSAVAASSLTQGSSNNIVYVAKMDVATQGVNVTSAQITLGGSHDADDFTAFLVYFNPTAPTFSGATFLNSVTPSFAGPHTYSITGFNRAIAAGSSGYFIFLVNVSATGTTGNTVKVNGATNPVVFGFSTGPNITNMQTDVAGTQTIQAADVTVTSSAVAASSLTQGSSNNIVYVAKMDVATQGVNVTSAQITLGGSHDADDFTAFLVYFNPTAPTFSGATFLNSVTPSFAGPHTYSITGFNRAIAAGSSGYFIFLVNVSATGTTGNTVKVNGATNPVVFGFSTGPNITNMQTDVAGTQTIQAADVTVTSSAVAASSLTQGSSNNIVYVAKMDVATQGVNVTSAQITLGGSHDADDFTAFLVYFNPTAPTFSGATFLNSVTPSFAGPHTYSITGFNRAIAAGSSGYFIFLVNVSATGTTGNTVKVNGATNPVVFGFSTGPNITNMQTDVAGTQVIQGAVVTLTSSAIPSSVMTLGSNNNVIYAVQMSVASQNATATSVQVTLSGTHDADDLTSLAMYFNASAPTFSGATFLNSLTPSFAGPHTYNITGFSRSITAGNSGYFLVVVNVSATATMGNTVKVNGATNPLVFGFSTGAAVNNNQTDVAGVQHLGAALPVTFTSFTAKSVNGVTKLQWKTVSETDNAYFDIEHSSDGISYTSIGRITGSGTTTTERQYEFIHQLPRQGNNFYRLKQVDLNSAYKYSNIVQVYLNGKGNWLVQVLANPVKSKLQLFVTSPEANRLLLQLNDGSGRLVKKYTETIGKGDNNVQLDVNGLLNGVYYLFIVDENGKQLGTEKILIKN